MAHKIYIKFSNGSTTQLVDMYNEARQNELIEDGFLMQKDSDGLPATVDSTELITENNLEKAQMLKAIAEKHASKNDRMAAQDTLSKKYGR